MSSLGCPKLTTRTELSRQDDNRVPGHPALTDPEPVRQMWQAFSQLGTFEGHVLDNTGMDPDQTAERVLLLVNDGSFRVSAG